MAEKAEWSELQTLPGQILEFGMSDAIASLGCLSRGNKSLFWGSTASPKAQAACEMRCGSTLGLMASSDLKGAGLLPAWGCPLFPAVCSGACLTPSESRFWSRHQWKTSPMWKQLFTWIASAIQQTEPPPSWGLDKQTHQPEELSRASAFGGSTP